MFTSTYLPVNMNRTNCAVYSSEKVFPKDKLLKAYALLTYNAVSGVHLREGKIGFLDSPEIEWTIPEVYLAYEAYKQAEENDFSYYIVKDAEGIPQLFISKAFKGHRLLVNAFTMKTILLGNRQLVNKAASLIDKTVTSLYSINLFNTLKAIESGSAKFLQAIIVNKDTDEEYMAVNPMTTVLSDVTTEYYRDALDELRAIQDDHNVVTESFYFDEDHFVRKDLPNSWEPMSSAHVKYLLETYDKVSAKKSNYIPICNEKYVPELYFSTNYRYLVDAKTFECVIIKNQHTKSLLTSFATKGIISSDQCMLAWQLAKTE